MRTKLAILVAIAALAVSFASSADATVRCRDARGRFTKCQPPPPPPPPPIVWVAAPLTNGGYARCVTVGGCHSTSAPCPYTTGLNPPAVCTQPNIIAAQGEVRVYAWNGCDAANPCRRTGAFWPNGHYPKTSGVASDWLLGLEGFPDEWEGVIPA